MEFAGLLGVERRKEKLKLERNKKKKFYLLYIIASYMGNGPSCPGGPGQVPLLPWPRAGLAYNQCFLELIRHHAFQFCLRERYQKRQPLCFFI